MMVQISMMVKLFSGGGYVLWGLLCDLVRWWDTQLSKVFIEDNPERNDFSADKNIGPYRGRVW